MSTAVEHNKFESILSIPDMDASSVKAAQKIFNLYRDKQTIERCLFDDVEWHLCDEYSRYNYDFTLTDEEFKEYAAYLKRNVDEFVTYWKTYVLFRMGELALLTLQGFIYSVKKVIRCPVKDL